jgi:hypothetical protein
MSLNFFLDRVRFSAGSVSIRLRLLLALTKKFANGLQAPTCLVDALPDAVGCGTNGQRRTVISPNGVNHDEPD